MNSVINTQLVIFKRIHGWVPKSGGEYRFMSIRDRYRSLEQTDNTHIFIFRTSLEHMF